MVLRHWVRTYYVLSVSALRRQRCKLESFPRQVLVARPDSMFPRPQIYLGHIQTETPYFQPSPISPGPFKSAKPFPGDPSFDHCDSDGGCAAAWGLRIINSEGITVHSAGLYSFFQEYYQDCIEPRECQKSVVEVKGSKDVILFNTFTIGITEIANGIE